MSARVGRINELSPVSIPRRRARHRSKNRPSSTARSIATTACQGRGTRPAPGASHRIKRLERETGTALVERVGRRLVLTAAGVTLAGEAADLPPRMKAVEGRVRRSSGRAGGTIRRRRTCGSSAGSASAPGRSVPRAHVGLPRDPGNGAASSTKCWSTRPRWPSSNPWSPRAHPSSRPHRAARRSRRPATAHAGDPRRPVRPAQRHDRSSRSRSGAHGAPVRRGGSRIGGNPRQRGDPRCGCGRRGRKMRSAIPAA